MAFLLGVFLGDYCRYCGHRLALVFLEGQKWQNSRGFFELLQVHGNNNHFPKVFPASSSDVLSKFSAHVGQLPQILAVCAEFDEPTCFLWICNHRPDSLYFDKS